MSSEPIRGPVAGTLPTYDRTTINSWGDVGFKRAVEATGRRKLVMTALWTEAAKAGPVRSPDAVQPLP